ncbi:MAG: hypothetical protein IKC46_11355, partial [Lachnospiraceae bacterium]|nr:hypothetical protein [Lachnospiraceae bacterium]
SQTPAHQTKPSNQPIKPYHQKLLIKISQTIKLNHQKLWQTIRKFDDPLYFTLFIDYNIGY